MSDKKLYYDTSEYILKVIVCKYVKAHTPAEANKEFKRLKDEIEIEDIIEILQVVR